VGASPRIEVVIMLKPIAFMLLSIIGVIIGACLFHHQATREIYYLPAPDATADPNNIRGAFGERLGERLEVSGVAGHPSMGLGVPFDVTRLNGKPLGSLQGVEISWYNRAGENWIKKEDAKIDPGYEYTFIGYDRSNSDHGQNANQSCGGE
jgi:hypothetical protein